MAEDSWKKIEILMSERNYSKVIEVQRNIHKTMVSKGTWIKIIVFCIRKGIGLLFLTDVFLLCHVLKGKKIKMFDSEKYFEI